MNVTAEELIVRAKKIGLPITKNAFTGTLESPVPDLPYMIYLIPHTSGHGADKKNNLVVVDWHLELYTAEDDEAAEVIRTKIETKVLHDMKYEKYIAYIDDEECFQTAYEVNGILQKMKGEKA